MLFSNYVKPFFSAQHGSCWLDSYAYSYQPRTNMIEPWKFQNGFSSGGKITSLVMYGAAGTNDLRESLDCYLEAMNPFFAWIFEKYCERWVIHRRSQCGAMLLSKVQILRNSWDWFVRQVTIKTSYGRMPKCQILYSTDLCAVFPDPRFFFLEPFVSFEIMEEHTPLPNLPSRNDLRESSEMQIHPMYTHCVGRQSRSWLGHLIVIFSCKFRVSGGGCYSCTSIYCVV